jgi:exodeoxyribonuclease-3
MPGHFHFARRRAIRAWACTRRKEPSEVIAGFGSPSSTPRAATSRRASTPPAQVQRHQLLLPQRLVGEERQEAKFRFLAAMYPHLMRLKAEREFILWAT